MNANLDLVGGPVEVFHADETYVCARIVIAGRPKGTTLTGHWLWRDLPLATVSYDLNDSNGEVLFSYGEDTVLKCFFDVPYLYIGTGHRLVLAEGDRFIGSYGLRVAPPAAAHRSHYVDSFLTAADPLTERTANPIDSAASDQTIFIGGLIALGHLSWINVLVTLQGANAPHLTKEIMGPPTGGGRAGEALQRRRRRVMAKQWRVSANVKQYHVQVVEAETAEEAWKVAFPEWSSETCVEWDTLERDGEPEEIEGDA